MNRNKYMPYISLIIGLLLLTTGCGGGGGVGGFAGSGIATIGSITIAWDAPTNNSDNSSLTDLAGYTVAYGQSSGNYTESVDIGNFTYATISNLKSGTWCFVTKAFDYSGNESSYSNEVCTNLSI